MNKSEIINELNKLDKEILLDFEFQNYIEKLNDKVKSLNETKYRERYNKWNEKYKSYNDETDEISYELYCEFIDIAKIIFKNMQDSDCCPTSELKEECYQLYRRMGNMEKNVRVDVKYDIQSDFYIYVDEKRFNKYYAETKDEFEIMKYMIEKGYTSYSNTW
jgi:hypothetical protein